MKDRIKKIWLTDSAEIEKEKIKTLFRYYLGLIITAEVVVFLLFWMSRIGEAGPELPGPVNKPFQWDAYFLSAFLVPVIITFCIGAYREIKNRYSGSAGKNLWPENITFTGGFAISLFAGFSFAALVVTAGIADLALMSHNSGLGFTELLSVFLACFVGLSAFGALGLLFAKYRNRVKKIRTEYKRAVSRYTGIFRADHM